jgi:hypothetical protein
MADRVIDIEVLEDSKVAPELRITVERRLLWFKPKTLIFEGSGTVWHQIESGVCFESHHRVETDMEEWLSDIAHGFIRRRKAGS